ncbi:MAG: LolA family protein [Candidatus Bipolaricaulota bacterium]
MNRNYTLWAGTLLVLLIALNLAGFRSVAGSEEIKTADEFVEKLEEEYRVIDDFSAKLSISGLEPPLQVEVRAISEPRILRVEYLSPPEMEDQFFLLEEDFLYQFMPAKNLVIKKDLKKSDIPVKAANLTPDYLLELVRSDELDVSLVSSPGELYFPWKKEDVLEFKMAVPWLKGEDSSNSTSDSDLVTPVSLNSGEDNYVLEVIPRDEDYQFARQVIKFDPDSFLPRELITYFEEEGKEPVRTDVEEVETNVGLEEEKLVRLPRDAEVISG